MCIRELGRMIDTSKVQERRRLHFRNVDDLLGDLEAVVTAERAGTLRTTGNWTAGQTLGHLAAWINYAYDGYPMKTPWFIRMILRRKVKKYLAEGMPAGVHIPNASGGTFATDTLSLDDGATRLRMACQRLKSREPSRFDSPAFGPMSTDDRIALNLRHAELHLGFLHP